MRGPIEAGPGRVLSFAEQGAGLFRSSTLDQAKRECPNGTSTGLFRKHFWLLHHERDCSANLLALRTFANLLRKFRGQPSFAGQALDRAFGLPEAT